MKKLFFVLFFLFLFSRPVFAADFSSPLDIKVWPGPRFTNPVGIASDSSGNIYIADHDKNRIMKYDGSNWTIYADDSQGTFAGINGLSIDPYDQIYVTDSDATHHRILMNSIGSSDWSVLGNSDSDNLIDGLGLLNPSGIFAAQLGQFFVADTGHHRVLQYNSMSRHWTSYGQNTDSNADGYMIDPTGVVAEPNNLYIVDTGLNKVLRYDFGYAGWMPTPDSTGMALTSAIALDPGIQVYVFDKTSHQVMFFNPEGNSWSPFFAETDTSILVNPQAMMFSSLYDGNEYRLFWANHGDGHIPMYDYYPEDGIGSGSWNSFDEYGYLDLPGNFQRPYGIAVNSSGEFFVLDISLHTIQKYDGSWSTFYDNSILSQATGIAIDQNNYIYYSNWSNKKVYRISPDGSTVETIADLSADPCFSLANIAVDPSGTNVYFFTTALNGSYLDYTLKKYNVSTKTEVLSLNVPEAISATLGGLAVDLSGNLFITDSGKNLVYRYINNEWSTISDGNLNYPMNIAVDSSGNLYIADSSSKQIKKFDTSNHWSSLGSEGTNSDQFGSPVGIAVDSSGDNVYTTDQSLARVQQFIYNIPTPTPTLILTPPVTITPSPIPTTQISLSSQNDNDASSTSHDSASAPLCSDSKPATIPNLFQINTTRTSAKLFFTPIANVNHFIISFSTKLNAEEHGADVSLAHEGVQNFTINLLKPNTTYYFKVRGQNGCMPGEWSNVIKITTNNKIYYQNSLPTKNIPIKTVSQKIPVKTINPTPVVEIIPTSAPESKPQTKPASPAAKRSCFLWWCW